MTNHDHLDTFALTPGAYVVGDKFHPAVYGANGAWAYWPNITHGTRESATAAARLALNDAVNAALAVINEWNLSLEGGRK
jgi:hypothetical protein